MKKLLVVIAIVVAAAACGGGAGSTTASLPNPDGSTGKPVTGGPVPQSGGVGGGTDQVNPVPNVVPTVQGPQVIRQAQLTLSVGSGLFDSKLSDLRTVVEQEGGFIAGTDAQSNPTTDESIRTGVITFMVPAAKFDETIDLLAKMGKVKNEHISGNDVSAQYVDLQARLANQMAQRDAMLVLLKRAQSIADIIAVQTQIGQITGQIEQLKGQIQYIEHNTSYSTVTVTMLEAGAPAQVARTDSWGFATALSDGAHNFVATINYVVTGLGAIGPVLVLLWVGYLLWRRSGRPGWPVAKHA
jgi:Domain of unknown function (DUF4349)